MGHKDFTLEPAKTAIIVVDMQNDFCSPNGAFARGDWDATEFNDAIQPNVELVARAREAGTLVVFTRVVWPNGKARNDLPGKLKPRNGFRLDGPALERDSWGVGIVDELTPQPGDLVIEKDALGSFVRTPLDEELKLRGIETVVVTGVVTYACVLATAFGARDHGYNVVMVKDAVGSFWADLNAPVFRIIDTLMGHAVTASELQFRSLVGVA